MEKLQKLLDEYQETIENTEKIDWEVALDIEMLGIYAKTCVAYSISKQFWFIKWLVENEKIDKHQVHILCWTDDMEYNYSEEELILMELAIQDNPIDFLVSILK